MRFKRTIVFALLFILTVSAFAQTGEWVEANTGLVDIAAGESVDIIKTLTLADGRIFTFVSNHSAGEDRDGVYQYDAAADRWSRIAPRLNQYGYRALVSSGTRIFAFPGGNSKNIVELDIAAGTWNEVLTLPDMGLNLSRGIDALDNRVYVPCRINNDDIQQFPDQRFQVDEEFVLVADVDEKTTTALRNPDNPLIIKTTGGNPTHPIALTNGKVYHYSTFEYRENNGTGGLYEWDGTNWISASAGLNAINITGTGFGPIGPIYSDNDHSKLFVQTQQGFYEKASGGWLKYFYRAGSLLFISADYLFLNEGNGDFSRVDKAITTSLKNRGLECIGRVDNFVTPDNGNTFLATMKIARNSQGQCSDDESDLQSVGIYRYEASYDQPGRVKNLHLNTGTYLGGAGANEIAETTFTPAGNLLVAGSFNSNLDAPTTTLLNANPDARGKVYELKADGSAVTQSIVLGSAIYDLDVNTTGEIAVYGDFGIAVLNADYSLKWSATERAASRPRLAIADDGKVVAVVASASNGAGLVKLYSESGSILHTNAANDNNGVTINDVEISSATAHNQYYVAGYTQASSVLQVAFLRAYELTTEGKEKWKTWGFGAGEVNTNENGADTRVYHVKATNDQLYVAGESAGGGPGGFTIFAYNGKDLSTSVALQGNDYFSDGTNSCGSCHITFLGRLDPANGVVEKGKFLHARLNRGKTNTLRNRDGDLEVDEQGNVLLVGVSAFQFQDRDVFNVNGNLVDPYAGGDQYVLMTTPDFNTRLMWGVFSKNKADGTINRIGVGQGRVAYLAQSDKGELMTTDNALRTTPYNTVTSDGSLSNTDAYLAVWGQKVWETANNDEVELAYIPADSCFRIDDRPCPEVIAENPTTPNSSNPNEPAPSASAISNLLTPNGDARNDVWTIDTSPDDPCDVWIYDRSGRLIFQENNYQNTWAGTAQGQVLPEGVYYYQVQWTKSQKSATGYITLLVP